MTVEEWYEGYDDEEARLDGFSIEWLRTTHVLEHVLPPAPARVADIAGGTGRYAAWLAGRGYTVDLLDLTPLHVRLAQERAEALGHGDGSGVPPQREVHTAGRGDGSGVPGGGRPRMTCVVGDARALPWADATFEAALIMGALYHLQERADRLACLAEAFRVLKPGGVLITAHIGRWASLFDGYHRGMITDPAFRAIVDRDLATGNHDNPAMDPRWFTTAHFHTPAEVTDELTEAGFVDARVVAVEGFASHLEVPAWCHDGEGLARLLADLAATESEPALLGTSDHLLGLARRP